MKNKYDLSCDTYQNGTEKTDNLYTVLDEENYLDYLTDNNFIELNTKLFVPFNIDLSDKKIKYMQNHNQSGTRHATKNLLMRF